MVHKHPKMVSRIKIGTTVEDNPLYVLKVKVIQELLILTVVQKYESKSYFVTQLASFYLFVVYFGCAGSSLLLRLFLQLG